MNWLPRFHSSVDTNEVIWGNKFIGKSLSHKQAGGLVVCYGA